MNGKKQWEHLSRLRFAATLPGGQPVKVEDSSARGVTAALSPLLRILRSDRRAGGDLAFDGVDDLFTPRTPAERREEDEAVRRLAVVFREGSGRADERSRPEAAVTPPTHASASNVASTTVQKLEEVLRQFEEIEEATRGLFDLRGSAAELCAAIDTRFGFDFSAIQLERREENTIATVAGTGMARAWVGLAKHRIEDEVRLRDIQADIFQERRVEIIAGTEDPILKRLDPFIGKTFRHDNLVRIFVPLVLVRDTEGRVLSDDSIWEPMADGRSGCEVLRLRLAPGQHAKVIGTVEAGFKAVGERAKKVKLHLAHEFARSVTTFVTHRAESIYQKTLTFILERVAEMALRLARANIATVQWGTIGEEKKVGRWETVGSGRGAQALMSLGEHVVGAIGGAPREGGLGCEALKTGQPTYLGNGLKVRNLPLHDQGIRATAVYPCARLGSLGVGQKVCLVYTHFREKHRFTEDDLRWVQHLARRSGDLLSMAFELAERRDHVRQLETIQRIVSIFSESRRHKTMPDLLSFIAWSTLNLHGADVVTIYRRDPAREGRLMAPPAQAGRLREPDEIDTDAKEDGAPMLVLRSREESYFVSNVAGHAVLDPHRTTHGFCSREQLRSTAAFRLVVHDERAEDTVGVMFVNYREAREFTADDKSRLQMLASLSSAAIRNFEMSKDRLVAESAIAKLVATSLPPSSADNPVPS